jgi:hypothetical protein
MTKSDLLDKYGFAQVESRSHWPIFQGTVDGVPVRIYSSPDHEKFQFKYRMNVAILISSGYEPLEKCLEQFEEQRKDMNWRRAMSYAKNNPPPAPVLDFQI